MLIISTLSLLISNAVTLRRDMAILFNRIAIISLFYCILQSWVCFAIVSEGIGLHGGLFHLTTITQIFHIFLYLITILILQLTSFYPRKVLLSEHSSLKDILFTKLVYYNTNIINKMGEHLKIIEYPAKQSGKLFTLWGKQPNSGDVLKLFIPNLDDLFHDGWTNYSRKVKIKKMAILLYYLLADHPAAKKCTTISLSEVLFAKFHNPFVPFTIFFMRIRERIIHGIVDMERGICSGMYYHPNRAVGISSRKMDNRGSKSNFIKFVKEQRVDGCLLFNFYGRLNNIRCTLRVFEKITRISGRGGRLPTSPPGCSASELFISNYGMGVKIARMLILPPNIQIISPRLFFQRKNQNFARGIWFEIKIKAGRTGIPSNTNLNTSPRGDLKNLFKKDFLNKRFYSLTLPLQKAIQSFDPNPKSFVNVNGLNPWFITGFTDGDGSFSVSITKKKSGIGWKISPIFTIGVDAKDLDLLVKIKAFFKLGEIFTSKRGVVYYTVGSIKDLIKYILPHFDKYPLASLKLKDYLVFKEIILLMEKGVHKTLPGLLKIFSLKANLNKGLPDIVKSEFTNIVPADLPEFKIPLKLNPYWLSGFITAEGSFFISIYINDKRKAGHAVSLVFSLSLHVKDRELLERLAIFLACGRIQVNQNRQPIEWVLTKLGDINLKLIPFLTKYSLSGVKQLDFQRFKEASFLLENKMHLTPEGITVIKDIKNSMYTR